MRKRQKKTEKNLAMNLKYTTFASKYIYLKINILNLVLLVDILLILYIKFLIGIKEQTYYRINHVLRNNIKMTRNEVLKQVWQKASTVDGLDPSDYRKDCFGRIIRYSHYGRRDSDFGWELDHIVPQSKGGVDKISNLQALHWENNVKKRNHCNIQDIFDKILWE